VGPYTAGNILDELERDVWAWRDALERKERIDALKGEGADAKED
jgi:hypothetical protein